MRIRPKSWQETPWQRPRPTYFVSHKAACTFKKGRGRRGEVNKTAEHEAQSNHCWKANQKQDSAKGMVTWPDADEIACHACKANGQHKENTKEQHLLRERTLQPFGRDDKSKGPPSQTRRHKQTDDACQKNKLHRIRGENGSEEFDKALQR
jgi:hypothetical protein